MMTTDSPKTATTSEFGTWIRTLGEHVRSGGSITKEDAARILETSGPEMFDLLAEAAKIRAQYHHNKVELCAIVNAKSGACSENCTYCAQSAHYKTEINIYKLLPAQQIIEKARQAADMGAKCFGIVTAWNTPPTRKDWDNVLEAVRGIRALGRLNVGASLGELDQERAAELKEAGLDRYNHNVETSARHFPNICTTHSREDRLRTIRYAKEAGLDICSGVIMGMGEEKADRVDVAFDLRGIGHKSVTMNFLHPIDGTPLQGLTPMSPNEILITIAMFRFVLPYASLRICGGRELNLRDMQSWMFQAGASGTMVGNYLTTSGRSHEDDHRMLADQGLEAAAFDPTERCNYPYDFNVQRENEPVQ